MEQRSFLKKGNTGRKMVDMEWVYQQLDAGRSVKSVALELNVSRSTLYRRHKEYQEKMDSRKTGDFGESEMIFPDIPGL